MKSLNHQLFENLLRRDFAEVRRLGPLARADQRATATMGSMATELLYRLAMMRFGPFPQLDEFCQFLTTPREPVARPISLVDAEAVLRAVLGEPEIARGMGVRAKMAAVNSLIVYLNDELKLEGAAVDALLDEIEAHCLVPANRNMDRLD